MTEKKNRTPFYLIDTESDFYRPLGVRLAICISVVCWAAVEIYNRDGFWGVLSGAAAIYCIYTLFISYNPPPQETPSRADEPEKEAEVEEPKGEPDDRA